MPAAKRRPNPPPAKKGGKATASERARKAGLTRLRRRVGDLLVAYIASGKATTRLKDSVARLKSDIDDWRDETGSRDIRATKLRLRNDGDDDWSCDSCEWIMPSMGRICFLVGCDPEWNNCSYICITLPRDPDYPVS